MSLLRIFVPSVFIIGSCLTAQPLSKPATTPDPHHILTIDVPLVLVPVHVTSMIGRPLTKLESNNFHVFDQGVEHAIKTFTKDDTAISVGVLFDSSGSMRNKMDQCVDAVSAFLKTANDADEHFLVEFGDRPKLSVPFTANSADLSNRIAKIKPFGRTALFDAIQVALKQMKSARNTHKAIVVFSDGGDNNSRRNIREIRRLLAETDIQVYAVGIFDQVERPKPTKEERSGPIVLDELAALTGGNHLRANLTNLSAISEEIGNELRSRYVLGYYPASEVRDGKYHRVKVTVTSNEQLPDLRISYRPGYYAASF